jgi:hypothetical protein
MNNQFIYLKKKFSNYFALFFLVVLATKTALIFFYGNQTPFWDQWNAEAENLFLPWLNDSLHLSNLFAAHNEHRIFTTRVLSLTLLYLNGNVWNPMLEMYFNGFLHVTALTFFLYFASKSLTVPNKKYLIVFSICLLVVPFGWENTLAGFQSQFYLLLLFSFVFFRAICIEELFSFKWWIGVVCGLLCPISLASGVLTLCVGALLLFIRRYLYTSYSSSNKSVLVALSFILIGFIAFIYTPNVPYHAELKANNFIQFVGGVLSAAAWPLRNVTFAFIIQAPLLMFVLLVITKKDWRNQRSYLYILAVGGWVFGQMLMIAYGRYSGVLASRYLDLFAIGLVVNFVALLILLEKIPEKKRKLVQFFLILWLLLVLIGMVLKLPSIQIEINDKKTHSLHQEQNVRAYLCTGKVSYLTNKPLQDLPYPDTTYLKSLLDNPKILSFLPGNIYEGNSALQRNSEGKPYCDFEKLDPPFEISTDLNAKSYPLISQSNILFNGWNGEDYYRSNIPNVLVYGSFVNSDGNIGILRFKAKKGERILFRSGPSTSRQMILINEGSENFSTILPISNQWTSLIFSNPLLPDLFHVTLIDAGSTWGEWSAVALKKN